MRYIPLLLALAACAADPVLPARCTPNVTIACLCPGGASGVQACDATGSGYGACQCAAPDGGAEDAVAAPDVIESADTAAMDTNCGTGRVRCGAACVDTLTDGTNCGTCGRVCGTSSVCVSGTCQVSVDAGGMDAGADAAADAPSAPDAADAGRPAVCPASCATSSDCDPCRGPGTTGSFCCIAGLCLNQTGLCPAQDAGSDARVMCGGSVVVRCAGPADHDRCRSVCQPRGDGERWCCVRGECGASTLGACP